MTNLQPMPKHNEISEPGWWFVRLANQNQWTLAKIVQVDDTAVEEVGPIGLYRTWAKLRKAGCYYVGPLEPEEPAPDDLQQANAILQRVVDELRASNIRLLNERGVAVAEVERLKSQLQDIHEALKNAFAR